MLVPNTEEDIFVPGLSFTSIVTKLPCPYLWRHPSETFFGEYIRVPLMVPVPS